MHGSFRVGACQLSKQWVLVMKGQFCDDLLIHQRVKFYRFHYAVLQPFVIMSWLCWQLAVVFLLPDTVSGSTYPG